MTRGWHSGEVLSLVATPRREWEDIPGVWVIGLIIGTVILIAAIRYMTRRR